jgi:hypothetical protein
MLHSAWLVPMTVQTPRPMPVSSPLTVLPNPKRSPWRGLWLGANPTDFWFFSTRCTVVSTGLWADPDVAMTATVAMPATPAVSAMAMRLMRTPPLGAMTAPRRAHADPNLPRSRM